MELKKDEERKYKAIEQVIFKEITQKQASFQLGISDCQVRRLIVIYHKKGKDGFIHKHRGKESNKK